MMLLGKCPLPFQSFDAEELIETSLWKVSKKGVHFEDAIHVDDDGVLLKNVTNLGREANVVAYEPLFDLRIDPTRFNFTPPASE
jgi:hypothetical protein